MTTSLYTTVFLRVRRLLQLGQVPLQRHMDLIHQQGLSADLNAAIEAGTDRPDFPQADFDEGAGAMQADAMQADALQAGTVQADALQADAVQTVAEVIHNWLQQTDGWRQVRATHDGIRPITEQGIGAIAESCTWTHLEIISDLTGVQLNRVHPMMLELGWGDRMVAYEHQQPEAAGVYFLMAYQSDYLREIGINGDGAED